MNTLEIALDIWDEEGIVVDTTSADLTEKQAQDLVDVAVAAVREARNGGSGLFELVDMLDDVLVASDLLESK